MHALQRQEATFYEVIYFFAICVFTVWQWDIVILKYGHGILEIFIYTDTETQGFPEFLIN